MSLRYRKITVKVGSNVLTNADGTLNTDRIGHLVIQIAALRRQGVEVVLVTSGAVAAGRSEVKCTKKLDAVSARQLWSAVGQVKLINCYAGFFRHQGLVCAQVLTTKDNFAERSHYLNMKNCFTTLLDNGVTPVVNENDTISVTELMFTDNDELSGLIASMLDSEALIILTNVEGIYDGTPAAPDTRVIQEIGLHDTAWLENIAPQKSGFGRGGMRTKSAMAHKVARDGIAVHIACGLHDNILLDLLDSAKTVVHTTFKPAAHRSSNVKKWIAYSAGSAKGKLIINDGAVEALFSSASSLLPIGVTAVEGIFRKDDIVSIEAQDGRTVGWGKTRYSSEMAAKEAGSKNSRPIIHYDYLYLDE